ncbi:MAG: hypothetical protein K0S09_880 [Sphingobacteriaceae bacterium]|jgi:hypothetical protein|nr:hypothetical protein [Sphingobacteriaceae bacterium]
MNFFKAQILKSTFYFLLISSVAVAQEKAVNPGNMQTRWAASVNASNAWKEYPRPQLVRKDWKNLNGYWQYAIRPKAEAKPKTFDGKILVPFSVESSLSGVGHTVKPDQKLWYKNTITVPASWKGKQVLLHFDAVDWETTLWVNGKQVAFHRGGSDPFTVNITPFLKSGSQELVVSVWDPTDTGTQPRGKQVLEPRGIWYTPVTGIWQTVWMEPVEKAHIKAIQPEADIDNGKVVVKNVVEGGTGSEKLLVKVYKNNKLIAQQSTAANSPAEIKVPSAELWTPESPSLYHLQVELSSGTKSLDRASSYFAMRKISTGKDELGYQRLLLNNKPVFQYGTLDQGWWPESLLTPPSDAAMRYDIDVLKNMGFNMLRKHIKVEPSRYYYYADSVGMLIWQDMVSGFATADSKVQHVSPIGADWNRPAESAQQHETEWKNIMDHLRFFPSIVVWVPFNEGWGQYDTKRIVEWTKAYDPTRVIDGVSGWADRKVGDMNDAHHYPGPGMEPAEDNPGKVIVLGEFGGLGLPTANHIWNPAMRNWGYRTYQTTDELIKEYSKLITNMKPMVSKGLAAAVYTQTTDVEGEVNGLMTYDREKIKIDPALMRRLHEGLYEKPVRTSIVFRDSELKPQAFLVAENSAVDSTNIAKSNVDVFSVSASPVQLKKGDKKWVMKTFYLSQVPQHIQLRILGSADVKVYINSKEVVNKFISTKRHYDEINLNDYAQYLKPGENTLLVKVNDVRSDSPFDIGMYSY